MMLGKQGDADTRGAVAFVARQLVSPIEGGQDLFAYGLALEGRFPGICAQVSKHYHELVAAQARDSVAFAYTGGKPLRDLPEQQVAYVVSEAVIEYLEVVQVDKQQRASLEVMGRQSPEELAAAQGRFQQLRR